MISESYGFLKQPSINSLCSKTTMLLNPFGQIRSQQIR